MNKKYSQAAVWVTIMIVAVIGLVALQVMYTSITDQTDTTDITDDQFTGSNTTCVDVTDNCILTLTSVENATGGETLGTGNYSICGAGYDGKYKDGILLDDPEYHGETLNATYTEVNCGHLTGLTALVVNNIPILVAIALLVFAAGYAVMKK